MKHEVTLASGAVLAMDVASFKAARRLRLQFFAELKDVKLELSSSIVAALLAAAKTKDRMSVLKAVAGQDVEAIKNLFTGFLASPDFEVAIFACMTAATYNRQRIIEETFEPEDARADFYPAAWEVFKINIAPFLKGLASVFPTPSASPESAPE